MSAVRFMQVMRYAAGGYQQDVVFYSDDIGTSFTVAESTPYGAAGRLQGMDECALTQMQNGFVPAICDVHSYGMACTVDMCYVAAPSC